MPLLAMFWAANLACDTLGQLAFKGASLQSEAAAPSAWWAILAKPLLWIGVVAFVFEAFFWLGFLSLIPLAQGVMLGSLNILAVALGGRLLFGEVISVGRAVGMGLVAIGIVLVGLGMP